MAPPHDTDINTKSGNTPRYKSKEIIVTLICQKLFNGGNFSSMYQENSFKSQKKTENVPSCYHGTTKPNFVFLILRHVQDLINILNLPRWRPLDP